MRGNISAEFLTILAALMIIFLIFTVTYSGQNLNIMHIKEMLSGRQTAYSVATAVNYVYLAGDGAQYRFNVIGKDNDENITFFSHSVESRRGAEVSSAPLLNGDINVSTLDERSVVIKNNDGVIGIDQ